MMNDYYKLDEENNPIPCSLREWGEMYQEGGRDRRVVAFDAIDTYQVSTVFLGLDHGWGRSDKPVLFETMIFGEGPGDHYQTRCCTWNEALEMHKHAIQWIKDGCKDGDDE